MSLVDNCVPEVGWGTARTGAEGVSSAKTLRRKHAKHVQG